MKAADVRWIRILRRKLKGTDVWRGQLSWILFKLLLYDDLVGVVTSRHVTKMELTLFDRPCWNPLLYVNLTALSSIRPKLLPIKVLHCVNSEFHVFFCENGGNIKYSIRTAKLMQMMPKHIFWPIIDCSGLYATGVTRIQCCFTPNRWAWSLPVTRQRWRSQNSIRIFRKPTAIREVRDSIFYRTGLIAH